MKSSLSCPQTSSLVLHFMLETAQSQLDEYDKQFVVIAERLLTKRIIYVRANESKFSERIL